VSKRKAWRIDMALANNVSHKGACCDLIFA
jgi:hypothetical protein